MRCLYSVVVAPRAWEERPSLLIVGRTEKGKGEDGKSVRRVEMAVMR